MGFAWRGWEPWQLLQPGCRALCCRAPILPEDAQSIIWLCPDFESDLIPDAAISDGPEMAKIWGVSAGMGLLSSGIPSADSDLQHLFGCFF